MAVEEGTVADLVEDEGQVAALRGEVEELREAGEVEQEEVQKRSSYASLL